MTAIFDQRTVSQPPLSLRPYEVSKKLVGQLICGDRITVEWLIQTIRPNAPELEEMWSKSGVENIRYTRLGVGSSFNSDIYRTEIIFQNGDHFGLIVKIPQSNATVGDLVMENTTFKGHDKEVAFYKMFANQGLWAVPRYYFGREINQPETAILLIEDKGRNVISPSVFISTPVEQIFTVSRELARMQAFAIKIPGQPWRHEFPDYWHTWEAHTVLNAACEPQLRNYDPEISAMLDLLSPVNNREFARFAIEKRPAELNAISFANGDLWSGNLLFKLDPKTREMTNELVGIIDYQGAIAGNSFIDLVRYVVMCVDAEVRRRYRQVFIDYFYTELKKAYLEFDINEAIGFTRDQCDELYDLCVVEQAIICIMNIPFFGANADKVPEIEHEERMKVLHKRSKEMYVDAIQLMKQYGWDKFKA
ncbi:unnamed protein product [Bursaphelenchus xylophilus]|uniref:(pine wood nematode) hypothetical protein n=1 Tax=Bursaphelenchus xylophilus TaxID=6326 RepID=A0A1I7RV25_BURXY|nr:unnamed protein product [Bursaphelenchus xylophilus]CAG9105181.1 unnamed protein product [Bursaphelenchus xylophilus]